MTANHTEKIKAERRYGYGYIWYDEVIKRRKRTHCSPNRNSFNADSFGKAAALLATAIYANAVPEPLQNFEIHSNRYSL